MCIRMYLLRNKVMAILLGSMRVIFSRAVKKLKIKTIGKLELTLKTQLRKIAICHRS